MTFLPAADQQVFVGKVPVCFMEKETNEIRRGRPSVIKATVEVTLNSPVLKNHVLYLPAFTVFTIFLFFFLH